MDLIPTATRRYADAAYWETRFESESHHEWFSNYTQFRHLLQPYIAPTARILILGNGTSQLPLDLKRDGFCNITATDICHNIIHSLNTQYGGPGLVYEVADMLALPYSEGSFDVVIEKGTLDVLFTEASSPWNPPDAVCQRMETACQEIHRVLTPTGQFFSITFTQPLFRKPHLTRHAWSCQIERFGEAGSLEYYIYHCKIEEAGQKLDSVREEVVLGFDSVHSFLDDASFLERINLTETL